MPSGESQSYYDELHGLRKKSEVTSKRTDLVNYLFTDLKALCRLWREEGFIVASSVIELSGYQLYIIEQWACQRRLNSSITSYTGNMEDKIVAYVVTLPRDPGNWTQLTREYFEQVLRLHQRPKETEHGLLYVTNLLSFPSNVNLVAIPDSDIRMCYSLFDVNEDMRRLSCRGRSVLTCEPPSDACEAKFRQIYKIHEKVPVIFAIKEVVIMVQICLFYCQLLNPTFVDGLLCDETINGLKGWWEQWGYPKYRVTPHDGTLGPSTVAGIISFICGIRNRLSSLNYKISKDIFDAENFVTVLRQFQKHERIPKTMRIDEETVLRLYKLADKGGPINSDLFGKVKSTVKEVSGKQVPVVGDYETLDLDKFISSISGDRARYLWLGKGTMRETSTSFDKNRLTNIPLASLCTSDDPPSIKQDAKGKMRGVGSKKPKQNSLDSSTGSSQGHNRADSGMVDMDYICEEQSLPSQSSVISTPHEKDIAEIWPDKDVAGVISSSEKARLRRFGAHLSDKFGGRKIKPTSNIALRRGSRNGTESGSASSAASFVMKKNDDTADEAHFSSASDSLDCNISAHINSHRLGLVDGGMCKGNEEDGPCKARSKDDIDLAELARVEKGYRTLGLHRSNSMGLIDHCVFRWKVPQSNEATLRKGYESVIAYEGVIQKLCLLDDISARFDDKIDLVLRSLNQNKGKVDQAEYKLQSVTRRQWNIKSKLHEVEALAARLHYESVMLDTRLRDVEESINTFVSRVVEAEQRVEVFTNTHADTHKPVDATQPRSTVTPKVINKTDIQTSWTNFVKDTVRTWLPMPNAKIPSASPQSPQSLKIE